MPELPEPWRWSSSKFGSRATRAQRCPTSTRTLLQGDQVARDVTYGDAVEAAWQRELVSRGRRGVIARGARASALVTGD